MIKNHLQKLVSKYPVSNDQGAVWRLLNYAEIVLKENGMPHVERLTYNGVHSLYASTRSGKHSKILLQAHIDVVPGGRQELLERDDKYFGRGVYDMLFAPACYLQMVEELSGNLEDMDFAIMLSGDEELGGFNSAKPFLEAGYTTDICILPDAGDHFGSLSVGAKGMYNVEVKVSGKAHHGSRPWEGDGAASKLAHFLTDLEKVFDMSDIHNSTMTVSMLSAGEAKNQGPNTAKATLDIRYINKLDLDRIKAEMNDLLDRYDGEIVTAIEGDDYQLDTSNPLVKSFITMYEKEYGNQIAQTIAFGSSDARFFSALNIPVVMLRPDGGEAHGDGEWISISSTEKFYRLLKTYVAQTALDDKSVTRTKIAERTKTTA